MKKLLALILSLLMLLPLILPVPTAPAQAEDPQYAVITLTSAHDTPSVIIEDAAFLRWLQALLKATAPCEHPEIRPADKVYEITFYGGEDLPVYTVYHDNLNNIACVTRPDGSVHAVSTDLPTMLQQAMYSQISFAIPENHRALLQKYSWTIAFRHPHMAVQLPAKLNASRTDPVALHFTWADIFLRDAGYDITPYLGKPVVPYVYTVYETAPRFAFTRQSGDTVRCPMYAVVLECDGQIIGAYLMACSWNGSDLMSLQGRTAVDLLGDVTIREHLLERLPRTTVEDEMAALPPEEVLRRYTAVSDPALMPIDVCLQRLGSASPLLYDPLALAAAPSGQTALSITQRAPDGDVRVYDVDTGARTWYPRLVYESPETGWKVESFYNSGY